MIFENPFKYRRKWERRGKKRRMYRNVSIFVFLALTTFVGYRYFFVVPEADPEAIKLEALSKGTILSEKSARQATDNLPPWELVSGKNPEQDVIDQRIKNLKSLPPISDKPFLHTAFVSQGDPANTRSILSHVGQIDMAFPDWLSLSGSDCTVSESIDWNVFETFNQNHIPVIPRFSGTDSPLWVQDFSNVLRDSKQSSCLIDALKQHIQNRSVKGINIDMPNLATTDRDAYTKWILSLTEAFHENGLFVTLTLPMNHPAFDYENIGRIADVVIIKAYGEHATAWEPGPLAGNYWFEKSLDALMRKIPPSKIITAVWLYGYDWNLDTESAPERRNFEQVLQLAENTKSPINWDKGSGNSSFSYRASDGSEHEVWFLDAVSAWNQYLSVRQKKLYGFSFSRLGNEDVSAWRFIPTSTPMTASGSREEQSIPTVRTQQNLSASQTKDNRGTMSGKLISISATAPVLTNVFDPKTLEFLPSNGNIVEYGTGKLYKILSVPQEWLRTIAFSGPTVTEARYVRFPTNLTISHFWNGHPKTIALVFQGSLDQKEGERLLDILKAYNIRATFFPGLKQIKEAPETMEREYREGHVVGSQASWSEDTEEESRQELDDTERALKSITDRQTVLAYAPYVDSQSLPPEQIKSLHSIGDRWYVFMDSDAEWKELSSSGADHVVENILSRIKDNDSSVIAVNEIPGNNTQALQALEKAIPALQSAGYRFVAADEMLGVSRDALMPIIPFWERLAMTWSAFVSRTKTWAWNFLVVLFVVTTIVSVLRIVFLGVFVLRSSTGQKKHFSPKFLKMPPVTILVPAYNEEKVIERTILWLLSSDYPEFEVLVVDDGSTDSTAECVRKVMETHKNVRLISKKNEGKSLALNIGFREARYDYIVTVDADTIVLPKTIYYLIEPFSDARVDAVCGNIGVGNVKNILTAFQEVEYVTGQNYDRRAFDALNCISVVPGATGAWKKQKVIEIGGYASDTLVEDADLTLTLLEHGGRIVYAPQARSVTEAPERVGPLFKQRFRWSYGTFQCFWKHRKTFGKWTLGLIALPNMLLFQVVFPALSPIGDLVLLSAIFFGNLQPILAGYILFFLMDAVISGIAYTLDKKSFANIWVILIQRFFYRQFMYVVTFKSIIAAISGSHHGWNKLERKGTVVVGETV